MFPSEARSSEALYCLYLMKAEAVHVWLSLLNFSTRRLQEQQRFDCVHLCCASKCKLCIVIKKKPNKQTGWEGVTCNPPAVTLVPRAQAPMEQDVQCLLYAKALRLLVVMAGEQELQQLGRGQLQHYQYIQGNQNTSLSFTYCVK